MPTAQEAQAAQQAIAEHLRRRPQLRIVQREPEPWVPECTRCNDVLVVSPGPYCNCLAGEKAKQLWDAMKAGEEAARQRRMEKVRQKLQRAGGFVVPERYKLYTPQSLIKLCGGEKSRAYQARKPAVLVVKEWSEGRLERPAVLLHGAPGTGKTALVVWAVRQRIKRTGEAALAIRYGKFINAVQSTYRSNGDTSKVELLLAASIAPLLILDDFGENALGCAAASNDKQNIIREVVDYRNMHNLPTVIITNLTPARLQGQFGPDIISRLQEMCLLVAMGGTDLRKKGAMGWNGR